MTYELIAPTHTTSHITNAQIVALMDNKSTITSSRLLGIEETRIAIFGTGKEAISKRQFAEWKARGFFPFYRIGGKRIFCDPEEVKRALSRRFKVNAEEAR